MQNDKAMGNSRFNRNELDHYPTPDWVSEAIIPYLAIHDVCDKVEASTNPLLSRAFFFKRSSIWEPACGTGVMADVLARKYIVKATDIHDYGYLANFKPVDFLQEKENVCDAIVTNPPYGDEAEKFIRHAIELTKPNNGVVAMLLRNEYDSSVSRIDLFREPPFARKVVLTSRPRWIEGSTGAPRHNYAWYIWDHKYDSDPVISYHKKEK